MKIIRFELNGKITFGMLEGCIAYPCKKDYMDSFSSFVKDLYAGTKIFQSQGVSIEEVKMLAPLKPIRNAFCVGKNYIDHADEMKGKTTDSVHVPSDPIFFSKASLEYVTDRDDVLSHKDISETLDYEVELVVIIGKSGRDIKPLDVRNYILGYAVGNDYSMRQTQMKHLQWLKGKSLDTHTAISNCIVTADEIDYPPRLDIYLDVNGERRQQSNTGNMIFDIDTLISTLSKGMTLVEGDVIFTGTPSGVGMGYNPPRYLSGSDVVECGIKKIGKMENRIIDKE